MYVYLGYAQLTYEKPPLFPAEILIAFQSKYSHDTNSTEKLSWRWYNLKVQALPKIMISREEVDIMAASHFPPSPTTQWDSNIRWWDSHVYVLIKVRFGRNLPFFKACTVVMRDNWVKLCTQLFKALGSLVSPNSCAVQLFKYNSIHGDLQWFLRFKQKSPWNDKLK